MAEANKFSNNSPASGSTTMGYSGKAIHDFFKEIEKKPGAKALDIGLVSNENIAFFAKRVKQLYICDFIRRLDFIRRKDLSFDTLLKDFNYPPLTFDCIFLWNYCDYLSVDEVPKFLKQCYMMAKPGGLIVAYAIGENQSFSIVNAYIVDENYNVHIRPQLKLKLLAQYRPNRKVLELFSLFTPIKSFICQNGFRGFVFRRN